MEREISISVEALKDKNAEKQKHRTGCRLELDALPPTLTPLGNTTLSHASQPHLLTGTHGGMLSG